MRFCACRWKAMFSLVQLRKIDFLQLEDGLNEFPVKRKYFLPSIPYDDVSHVLMDSWVLIFYEKITIFLLTSG